MLERMDLVERLEAHVEGDETDLQRVLHAILSSQEQQQSSLPRVATLDVPTGVEVAGPYETTSLWEAAKLFSDSRHSLSNDMTEPLAGPSSSLKDDEPVALQRLRQHVLNVSDTDEALYGSILSTVAASLERSNISEEERSALLAETLGFDNLDLVTQIVQEKKRVLSSLNKADERNLNDGVVPPDMPVSNDSNTVRERQSTAHRPYIPGASLILNSQSEIEEGKRRKAEHRRLQRTKHLRVNDIDESSKAVSSEEMALIRAQSLQEASQRPLFSSDRVTPDQPKYPHVYSSNTGGNILSAFGSRFALPAGTTRMNHDLYEEVTIPPPSQVPMRDNETPIPIEKMDAMVRGAFPGYKSLNRLQSAVYPLGYGTNENLLICAPTGAGKTDVAMLTVLRTIQLHALKTDNVDGERRVYSGERNPYGIRYDDFKIVYVAPMKALAAEIVGKFSKRLKYLGIMVRELTGDMQMTRQEIAETQMIVTTPEKWDVVTRKPTGEGEMVSKVKLLIIDEVHLLHEERGAVIETIVARTLRLVESSQSLIRIVGLSATLPNYVDVADFLRVNRYQGLFFFDSSFRPVPLEQHFIGIKGKANSPVSRQNVDKATFEKLQLLIEQGHQVMIFVHARKETVKTAYAMRDMFRTDNALEDIERAREENRPDLFARDIVESRNRELKELYETGFGIHHAGMLRKDRTLTERMFEKGVIRILCCTSTLAWGVNLPAYAVIIKGTDVYDSSLGRFSDLSILDVLQIFGRAGRPQYESIGVGYIVTSHEKLSHYVDAITSQHPIESRFKSGLIDALNAEIALGSVNSISDGVSWLSYTYLFTRMRRNPLAYGMLIDEVLEDPHLGEKRLDEITNAVKHLVKCHMIEFDEASKRLTVTEQGRIAARYYITYKTIEIFNEALNGQMTEADLLGVFGKATDFEQIIPRENEVQELKKLQERVPCEINGACDTPAGKSNLLLQAYISRFFIEDFALVSDSAYVAQNAGRIMRALFEIALTKHWAITATSLIGLTKAIEKRIWPYLHPLMQSSLKPNLIHQLTQWADEVEVKTLARMSKDDIATLCKVNPQQGDAIREAARRFPMLKIKSKVRTLLHNLVLIEVIIERDFHTIRSQEHSEPFYVWVESQDNNEVLQSKRVLLRPGLESPLRLAFMIETNPGAVLPNFWVRWLSERWIGSEDLSFISCDNLVMPASSEPPTPLIDLPLLSIAQVGHIFHPMAELLERHTTSLNAMQTQTFHAVTQHQANLILSAPSRSGKSVMMFMAVLRMISKSFSSQRPCDILILYPTTILARQARKSFDAIGRTANDIHTRLLFDYEGLSATPIEGRVTFTTPSVIFTAIQRIPDIHFSQDLIIAEDIHLSSNLYELVMSTLLCRTSRSKTRWLLTSSSLENTAGLEAWLQRENVVTFNFSMRDRPSPLRTTVMPFELTHSIHLLRSMVKPAYDSLKSSFTKNDEGTGIIFVPLRSQCLEISRNLIRQAASDIDSTTRIGTRALTIDLTPYLTSVKDSGLAESLQGGIGVLTDDMASSDKRLVLELYTSKAIRTLILARESCWSLQLYGNIVIIMSAQTFSIDEDAAILADLLQSKSKKEGVARVIDYHIGDILRMQSFAASPITEEQQSNDCYILCQSEQSGYIRRVLDSGVVLESSLFFGTDVKGTMDHRFRWIRDNIMLSSMILTEINNRHIRTLDDITHMLSWTFARYRMALNPCYYGSSKGSWEELGAELSKFVDDIIQELEEARCIEVTNGLWSKETNASDTPLRTTWLGQRAAGCTLSLSRLLLLRKEFANDPETIAHLLLSLPSFKNFSEHDAHHINQDDESKLNLVLDATRSCISSEVLAFFHVPCLSKKSKTQDKSSDEAEESERMANLSMDLPLTSDQHKALLLAAYCSGSQILTPQQAIQLKPRSPLSDRVKTLADVSHTLTRDRLIDTTYKLLYSISLSPQHD